MNKKAAMELGINTVVILVIALVIIAGGIVFITRVFNNLDNIGPVEMPNFPATADSPLMFASANPELKMGSKEYFDVNVYNKQGSDTEINLIFGMCKSDVANPDCAELKPVLIALPQTVPSGESSGFRTLLKANCASAESVKLMPGEYICSMKAVTTTQPSETISESQVVIKVTN